MKSEMLDFIKLFMLAISVYLIPEYCFATGPATDPVTMVLCNVIVATTGTVAKGVATVVIVISGYTFFVGKASGTMLMIIMGGTMLVFGAETITSWIMGETITAECQSSDIVP